MSEANPYSAPDASLDNGQDVLYSPKVLSFSGRIGRMRYLAYGVGVSMLLMLVGGAAMGLAAGAMYAEAGLSIAGFGVMGLIAQPQRLVEHTAVSALR
jgi:uncharacterized membrane protein YhaH (DUF805 family)